MKKLTIRLEDYIYDRLFLVANENSTSANKVVATILEEYINQPREINYLKEIDEKLKKLIELEDDEKGYKSYGLNSAINNSINHIPDNNPIIINESI